jgi:REP element-mobilizing transposase RayT
MRQERRLQSAAVERDCMNKQPAARYGPPYNPGLKKMVEAKVKWHYSPDAAAMKDGFLGWHERGYLPHFDAPHVTQFLTLMLQDAFPVSRRREWEPILWEADESVKRRKLERWLDRGCGECWLRNREVARVVEECLLLNNGRSYRLQAWCIMPNHVHLVVDVWDTPLSDLLQVWKGRSAFNSNKVLNRRGKFWEREYFDTLITTEAHLRKAIRYTESNPTKAKFVRQSSDWEWTSARLRKEFGELPIEPHRNDSP